MTGKIIKGIAGFYYVHDGHSKTYECKAKGIFRNRHIKPLVGDNVEISILDEAQLLGNIDQILPRTNMLIRPAVSNVDQALVVFSVTQPEPNLNLLDRFLVMMQSQDIPVVICFNKVDLATGEEQKKYCDIYENAGYQVCFTSAQEQVGVEAIRGLMKGRTTVFAGPSGVGKSSLTNLIQPKAEMETGALSEKIKRGKHTTRHAELFYVEAGTYMMDTPGFSSMSVGEMEEQQLRNYFPEFKEWEEECRFLGCVHIGEPVCGIKKAVTTGSISESRYENYRLIYQELKDKRRY